MCQIFWIMPYVWRPVNWYTFETLLKKTLCFCYYQVVQDMLTGNLAYVQHKKAHFKKRPQYFQQWKCFFHATIFISSRWTVNLNGKFVSCRKTVTGPGERRNSWGRRACSTTPWSQASSPARKVTQQIIYVARNRLTLKGQ
jgi:hypothetical protein